MSMRSFIQQFDSHVTTWVYNVFPQESWRGFFMAITTLGDPISVIIITIMVAGAGVYGSSVRLVLSGIAIPGVVAIGAAIKLFVERARPINDYSAGLATFSFPSGHSTGSMVAFGLLAYIAYVKLPGVWGLILAGLLLLIPILVGVSRIHLGAHYPSDVMAGWLLGIMGLLAIIFIIRPL